ncbi:DEAD/DEAH box helicase [Sporobolomyces salmoneus]|uniref:DEAD/DEAH box helicase n=1 Tax=Sporobolomyces salmoneus TaxID=183962 RepID=UPI003175BA4C
MSKPFVKPRPLSSQPKRKWGDEEDSEEENSTPDFVLGSEDWPLTPPKPKVSKLATTSTSTSTAGAKNGKERASSSTINSSNNNSSSSSSRALSAKPSFTTATKLAPIFGTKPSGSSSSAPSTSKSRSTSVPASSSTSSRNPSGSAPSAYAYNQQQQQVKSNVLPKKRVLPWDNLEAEASSSSSKISRSGNFHELSGPGSSRMGGVKGQMLTSTTMDIKQKVILSPEQQMVHKLVVDDGKSVFFTGSAGTGKSVLLREIISSLKRKHKGNADAVAVTASTGMAACNIGGTTIHSFAGIGIGIDSAQKLIDKVKKNKTANAKWQRCKVLVIDEVSMVDGILFDKLAEIGTALKKRGGKGASSSGGKPFGGIQLVVTGDFFQLPPVTKGVTPTFAFEAKSWQSAVDHTVNLTQVFRQKDTTFIDMLNEMRFGQLSQDSIQKFKNLAREPKYAGVEPTELFPLRHQVDVANQNRLRALKGEEIHFKAEDWAGDGSPDQMKGNTYLNNFMAPDRLVLKIGAQVMLIKNLDATLVNGTVGTVVGFGVPELEEDSDNEEQKTTSELRNQARIAAALAAGKIEKSPMIDWQTPGGIERKIMAREEFKVEDNQGRKLASRKQYPIILAWAMSIHKSQGQTIACVKVDLGKVFEKGQSYVALSRATSLEGLQVLNFDAKKVLAHQKVIDWSKSLTILGA